MDYSQIYFAITSVATLAVAGLMVLVLMYVLSILHDVKRLSKIAKKEVNLLGTELSSEAAGFVRTVFALLLSQFGGGRIRRAKRK